MTQSIPNGKSRLERARQRYDQLRSTLETSENIGKLVAIDIETGNYAVGDDRDLDAPRSLQRQNPDAVIVTLRIGYNAVYALGGTLERSAP